MRTSTIERIVLIVIGGFLFVQAGRFAIQRDGLMVANTSAAAAVSDPVATWAAGAAILSGVALVAARVHRRA